MNLVKEYGITFILGGVIVSGIKYTSQNMSQKYASIIGALPIGLFSILFIVKPKDSLEFIKNYIVQIFLIVIAGLSFIFILTINTSLNLYTKEKYAYYVATFIWLLLSTLKVLFINI